MGNSESKPGYDSLSVEDDNDKRHAKNLSVYTNSSPKKNFVIYDGEKSTRIDPEKTYMYHDETKTHLVVPINISMFDKDSRRVLLVNALVDAWDTLVKETVIAQLPLIRKKFVYEGSLLDLTEFVWSRWTASMIMDDILCGKENTLLKFKRRVMINSPEQISKLPDFVQGNNCIIDVRFDDFNKNYVVMSMGDCCYGINCTPIQLFPSIIKLTQYDTDRIWLSLDYEIKNGGNPTVYIYPFDYQRVIDIIKDRGLTTSPMYKQNVLHSAFFKCLPSTLKPCNTLVCFGSSEEYKQVISKYKRKTTPVIETSNGTLLGSIKQMPVKNKNPTITPELSEKIKNEYVSHANTR